MYPYFNLLGEVIHTYPFILGIIWALSYHLGLFIVKRDHIVFPHYSLFFFLAFISAWICAKLTFLLTLDHELVNKIATNINFWLGGGFVFYGGAIGVLVISTIFRRINKIEIRRFDFFMPIIAWGHGLGRIACFMAGCCYGKRCSLPWAVNMAQQMRHPVQIYEALLLIALGIVLYQRYRSKKEVVSFYLISYALLRFFMEFFRGDRARGLYFDGLISTSQIIALMVLIMVGIYQLKIALSKKN